MYKKIYDLEMCWDLIRYVYSYKVYEENYS